MSGSSAPVDALLPTVPTPIAQVSLPSLNMASADRALSDVPPDANPLAVDLAAPSAGVPLDASMLSRARTRLQNNIRVPKKLFPGIIRYGHFAATGEPDNLKEALADEN